MKKFLILFAVVAVSAVGIAHATDPVSSTNITINVDAIVNNLVNNENNTTIVFVPPTTPPQSTTNCSLTLSGNLSNPFQGTCQQNVRDLTGACNNRAAAIKDAVAQAEGSTKPVPPTDQSKAAKAAYQKLLRAWQAKVKKDQNNAVKECKAEAKEAYMPCIQGWQNFCKPGK